MGFVGVNPQVVLPAYERLSFQNVLHKSNATPNSSGIRVQPRRGAEPHVRPQVAATSRLPRNIPALFLRVFESLSATRIPAPGREREIVRARSNENVPGALFAPTSGADSIGIGSGTEFLLEGRDASTRQATLLGFARMLKDLYHHEVPE